MRKLAVVAVFSLAMAATGQAAVTYVDADATGANTGASWTDAYTDLQSALAVATSSDEIWVAEGTYRPTSGADRTISFELAADVAVYGGFAGTEALLTERDWVINVTVLSGDIGAAGVNSDNSYTVVVVVAGAGARLDGFTVTGGNSNGPGDEYTYGGGMYTQTEGSPPTVANCTFTGNTATYGGGMHTGYLGSSIVTNCMFTGNSSTYEGTAMDTGAASVTITNCTFWGNTGGGAEGCGIDARGSSVTVTNCIIWGNAGPEIRGTCTVTYSCVEGGYAGNGNINLDPLFVDAAGGDLRLQQCSPCIDAGFGDTAPVTDIEGNARWDDPGMDDVGVGTPTYVDMGAYEFQGTSTPSITIAAPNGGETWYYLGADRNITWTSAGIAGNVDIHYSADGGSIWTPVATDTADTGSFTWTIPNEASANCLVRLQETGGAGLSDVSDAPFTITPATITVTSPNGGETWYFQGADQAITWTSAGVAGNVDIHYSVDGGTTWSTVAFNIADSGSYTWTIPNEDSAQCLVRVQETGGAGPSDVSDAALRITPKTITLTLLANATEGDGTLAGQGTVTIPGTWVTDLMINLASDDTTELAVLATVTILQGDTSATFDLTIEDDGRHDGTQTVTVTASAAGWTGSSADIDIVDIDPAPKKSGCAPGAGSVVATKEGPAVLALALLLALGRRRHRDRAPAAR